MKKILSVMLVAVLAVLNMTLPVAAKASFDYGARPGSTSEWKAYSKNFTLANEEKTIVSDFAFTSVEWGKGKHFDSGNLVTVEEVFTKVDQKTTVYVDPFCALIVSNGSKAWQVKVVQHNIINGKQTGMNFTVPKGQVYAIVKINDMSGAGYFKGAMEEFAYLLSSRVNKAVGYSLTSYIQREVAYTATLNVKTTEAEEPGRTSEIPSTWKNFCANFTFSQKNYQISDFDFGSINWGKGKHFDEGSLVEITTDWTNVDTQTKVAIPEYSMLIVSNGNVYLNQHFQRDGKSIRLSLTVPAGASYCVVRVNDLSSNSYLVGAMEEAAWILSQQRGKKVTMNFVSYINANRAYDATAKVK